MLKENRNDDIPKQYLHMADTIIHNQKKSLDMWIEYAKDITLPQNIGGSLNLEGLTNVEDLTFPQKVSEIHFNKSLKLKMYIKSNIEKLREIKDYMNQSNNKSR